MAKKQFIVFPAVVVACLLIILLKPVVTRSTERNFDRFVSQYHGYSPQRLSELSDNYLFSNKPDSAIAGYTMLANEIKGKKDSASLRMMAETYNKLGYIYLYQRGDNNSAYAYLLGARDISEENGFSDILSAVYLNLGNTILPSDEKEALKLFRLSIDNSVRAGDYRNANVAFLNMVNIAMSLADRNILRRILESYSPDSAPDSVVLSKYTALTARGAYAFLEGDYPAAEAAIKEASEDIDTDLQPERYLLQALGNLVEVYRAAGDHRKMTDMLRHMEGLCSEWKVNDMLIEIYRNMADILSATGVHDEAQAYEKKYLTLSDSLYSYRRGYELKNVETRHEVTKMNEKLQESDQISRNRLRILIIAIATILVLGIIVILVWRQKKRVDDLLLELYSRHRVTPVYGESTTSEVSDTLMHSPTVEEESGEVGEAIPISKEKPKERYSASHLSDDEKSVYAERITKTLQDSGEAFSQGFNIDKLAELSGLPTKTVSRVINESFGMNFNSFINTYRIKEATIRLESEAYDNLTIDVISEELGFRNRSHFAAVFKSSVGMSPSDFRRAARLKRMMLQ